MRMPAAEPTMQSNLMATISMMVAPAPLLRHQRRAAQSVSLEALEALHLF